MLQKQDIFQASSAKGEVPIQWEELDSMFLHQTDVSGNKFYPTM